MISRVVQQSPTRGETPVMKKYILAFFSCENDRLRPGRRPLQTDHERKHSRNALQAAAGRAFRLSYVFEIARIRGWSLSVRGTELTLLSIWTAEVPFVGS